MRSSRVRGAVACLLAIVIRPCVAVAHSQPASTVGTIAGQVIDSSTGDAIIEAGVEVVGAGKTVRTDLDGRYSVKVPPGTYQVRFFAPLYQSMRVEKVVVQADKVATTDASLRAEGATGVQVVEVVAQAVKAAETTQLVKRQRAPVVSDNIGAETITKSPDANAAEIVQRVPAVTIKDNKFIFVRGLGERYSNALLDGSRLPSPDPERRVVPLDLFPAEFIDSISVVKTFTPDLPGDFSGGLADIELLDFPQQLTYGLGISTAGNSQTTFQRFDTYKGSTLDYFGFGGDARKLPSIIPGGVGREHPTAVGPSTPIAQRQALGRSFADIWDVETATAPVDFNTAFQIGDRFGPLGVRLAADYGTEYRSREHQVERIFLQSQDNTNPKPALGDHFIFDRSNFHTRLGGVFTAAYEISPEHHLSFRSLIDRNSDDEVLVGHGAAEQTRIASQSTRFTYTQDELDFGQLSGAHHFHWGDVDWRSALSRTTRNVPDERIATRDDSTGSGRFALGSGSDSPTRIFEDLSEHLTDSQLDVTIPFTTRLPVSGVWSGLPAKFKIGSAYLHRARTSSLRIFEFQPTGDATGEETDLFAPTGQILSRNNLRPDGGPIGFLDNTQAADFFKASHEIAAGYGLVDLPLVRDRLRLIAGVRMEYSYITLDTVDVHRSQIPVTIVKNNLDPLPGVNLVYSPRSDMNVRAAWSKTVSRPEFRELSPAVFPAPRSLRPLVGNPDLVETGVDSYDLRWEWFFAPSELISVSGFYKTIAKPIEIAANVSGSAPQDTFSQNKDAKLAGFEFEARKNLGFVTSFLDDVNFLTNVSYVHSEVTAQIAQLETTRMRPLQGQADYVVNAAIEYVHPEWGTARLLYNTVGPTISAVQDVTGLPDFIQARRDQVDLVLLSKIQPFGVPLNVKLSVENLLNDRFLTTVGGEIQETYRTGVTASLGISYFH